MNILFVLYGDFTSNSANPLALYARELQAVGHNCAIAVPTNLEESIKLYEDRAFTPVLYGDVLKTPDSVFPDGRPADVIHACTSREVVRVFVTSYMRERPTPLVIYLEDNERWIATRALGLDDNNLDGETDQNIAELLPDALSHPFRYGSFIGLADAVAVIQDKLKSEVPPWVHCETIMIGVDLESFSPQPPDPLLRTQYGVAETERVIVYHGGVNGLTKPALETLCRAVGMINEQGYPCRLLRTGPFPLNFLDQLPNAAASAVCDLGMLPKRNLPGLLALADLFVQPGKIDPFEDLRLPGKVPEFLAMGRPVVMPDANIAHLFADGVNAVLLRTGSAEEIAAKCIELFLDPRKASAIGRAGRLLAEQYFDVRSQARRLEGVYKTACNRFNPAIASKVWCAQDEQAPVALLLARKLRMLADLGSTQSECDAGDTLREHARHIEFMQQRMKGLEAAIADQDEQIASLTQAVSERDERIANLEEKDHLLVELNQRLFAIERTIGWKLLERFRRVRERAFPLQSRRRKAYWILRKLFQVFLEEDFKNGVLKIGYKTRQVLSGQSSLLAVEGYEPHELNSQYQFLIQQHQATPQQKAHMKEQVGSFAYTPLISIVVPVYNIDEIWLRKTIESVLEQIYDRWELCLVNDGSTRPHVRPLLEEYAERDTRIHVRHLEQNQGIAGASSRALGMATGEFVGLLDHDDELAPEALFEVVNRLNADPQLDYLYSDEDKLDHAGRRVEPFFKPDWSPDLHLSLNYVTHFSVFRRKLLEEVGGFRRGFDGSQDYDLMLRVSEKTKKIAHIPKVLYHWRKIPGSAAASTMAKPFAHKAAAQALEESLKRRGYQGWIETGIPGHYTVRYQLTTTPLISIIIPTRDRRQLLERCVKSIQKKTDYSNYEIIILDNLSSEPDTLKYLKRINLKHRVCPYSKPFNFAAMNNFGASHARGEYFLFLNNDTEVIDSGWLRAMLEHAQRAEVGAVGAKLLYPNGRIQHAGVVYGVGGVAGHAFKGCARKSSSYFGFSDLIRNCSAVTAACMMVPRRVFEELRGFDERFRVAFNDVDLCLRMRERGYLIVYTPLAQLYHYESATRGTLHPPDDEELAWKVWGDVIRKGDPYYNPHLTVSREDWSLRDAISTERPR